MTRDLTDLSGIGKKTAEKLREDGIDSPSELAAARRRGDDSLQEFNKRVQDAAIDVAQEQYGSYYDPQLGVRVTEENRSTIDLGRKRGVSDISNSGSATRNNPRLQDASLLDLGRRAVKGGGLKNEIGRVESQQDISDTVVTNSPSGKNEVKEQSQVRAKQGRRNVYTFGVDVAAELANVDRGTIERANEIRDDTAERQGPKTAFTTTYTSEIAGETKEFERDVRVSPREFAAAKRVHQARSADAKRVDNRRKAEVTGEFDKWIDDPSRHDFPNVDTPERGADAGSSFGFTPDETELEARVDFTPADQDNEFEVRETSADGGSGFGRVESKAGKILSASQEEQRIVLNDLLPGEQKRKEIGLELRGPDRKLFESDAEGDIFVEDAPQDLNNLSPDGGDR